MSDEKQWFWLPSVRGFKPLLPKNAPLDAKAVTIEQRDMLIQAEREGKRIDVVNNEVVAVAVQVNLEEYKAHKRSLINAEVERNIIKNFASEALGTTHFYKCRHQDQTNLNGLKDMGIDFPLRCINEIGIYEPRFHTAAQIQQVFADGFMHITHYLSVGIQLKAQIESATTKEEVDAVEWTET